MEPPAREEHPFWSNEALRILLEDCNACDFYPQFTEYAAEKLDLIQFIIEDDQFQKYQKKHIDASFPHFVAFFIIELARVGPFPVDHLELNNIFNQYAREFLQGNSCDNSNNFDTSVRDIQQENKVSQHQSDYNMHYQYSITCIVKSHQYAITKC